MAAAPDYALPVGAIARTAAEPRDAARLLVDRGPDNPPDHRTVADLPDLIGPGDLLVLNETKVLPARLLLTKPTGGAVEVLLLEAESDDDRTWAALVRPSARVAPGTCLVAGPARAAESGEHRLAVEVGERLDGGRRRVRLHTDDPAAALRRHGTVPLPPYLAGVELDPERYQTVYATLPGSVAAPTAGLHLTVDLLARCRAAGAGVATVDLAVGLDTFRPVTAERLEDHVVHSERYAIPPATWEAVEAAGRVVAVGTTTVRALESAAATGELAGRTRLLITPGHEWRVVDALLTNFHLPRSTLLLLVEALIGPRWRGLYSIALNEGYRFLSLGDAMFLCTPPS